MLGVGCKSGPFCPPRKGLLFRNVFKTSGCLEVGIGGWEEREDDQTEVLLWWEDLFGDVDAPVAGCCRAPPPRVTAVSGNSTPPGPPSASWFRKSAAERAERAGRPGSSFSRPAERIQDPGESEALCSLVDSRASGQRRGAEPGRRARRGDLRRRSAWGRVCAAAAAAERAELVRPAEALAAARAEAQRLVWKPPARRQKESESLGGAGAGVKAPRCAPKHCAPNTDSSRACPLGSDGPEPGAPRPWPSPTWPPSTCSRTSC